MHAWRLRRRQHARHFFEVIDLRFESYRAGAISLRINVVASTGLPLRVRSPHGESPRPALGTQRVHAYHHLKIKYRSPWPDVILYSCIHNRHCSRCGSYKFLGYYMGVG